VFGLVQYRIVEAEVFSIRPSWLQWRHWRGTGPRLVNWVVPPRTPLAKTDAGVPPGKGDIAAATATAGPLGLVRVN